MPVIFSTPCMILSSSQFCVGKLLRSLYPDDPGISVLQNIFFTYLQTARLHISKNVTSTTSISTPIAKVAKTETSPWCGQGQICPFYTLLYLQHAYHQTWLVGNHIINKIWCWNEVNKSNTFYICKLNDNLLYAIKPTNAREGNCVYYLLHHHHHHHQ